MKKILFAALLLSCISPAFAQNYLTRTGKISFNASAPKSPEKIEAINNEVANMVNAKTGAMVFQVLVKSFKFERELMQEHFNENYMESEKYPKADFKGSFTNLNEIDFTKDGTYNAKVAGKLTIHNVTKDVSIPGTVTVKGGAIKLKANFAVKLQDYNINIPSAVSDKIAKEVSIQLESDLTQK